MGEFPAFVTIVQFFGQKLSEIAVLSLFQAKNRDFRPPNRPFWLFGPFSKKFSQDVKRRTVLNVFVEKFGLTPITTPDADLIALAG